MKHSIRTQYAGIFIALMAGTILISWIITHIFLETFYTMEKKQTLLSFYAKLNETIGSMVTDEEEGEAGGAASTIGSGIAEELDELCFQNNIAVIVLNFDSEAFYASRNAGRELNESIIKYFLSIYVEGFEQIQNNTPIITPEPVGNLQNGRYMEMFGTLQNGYFYAVRTPMESIEESANIANLFLAYVGTIMVILSGILIWLISRRIAKPILELARISERMTHLDFEVKYQGKSHNEMDLLGENINKLSGTLETTIRELKTANNELIKDIEKKEKIDEMRKEFLSNVSHELKTPIALIQGYAEGLQEGINEDPESRAFYCEVIVDEAAKMNTMVQKLLTLNQLEFGNDMIHMERFDITELIRDYIQSAAILTKQNGITVKMNDYPPIFVWGDEFKIEEVFMNYFTNAVHHCMGEKLIEVILTKREEKVRIAVFNTGEPIPDESMGQLWDKFYKVDKARTREYGGSGIGLSIVKAIMDAMNQQYGVQNYNNGVQFWFELDRVAEEAV
jgi:signal transduction histidine kinase